MIDWKKMLRAVLLSSGLFGASFAILGIIWVLVSWGNIGAVIFLLLMIAMLAWAVYERD